MILNISIILLIIVSTSCMISFIRLKMYPTKWDTESRGTKSILLEIDKRSKRLAINSILLVISVAILIIVWVFKL